VQSAKAFQKRTHLIYTTPGAPAATFQHHSMVGQGLIDSAARGLIDLVFPVTFFPCTLSVWAVSIWDFPPYPLPVWSLSPRLTLSPRSVWNPSPCPLSVWTVTDYTFPPYPLPVWTLSPCPFSVWEVSGWTFPLYPLPVWAPVTLSPVDLDQVDLDPFCLSPVCLDVACPLGVVQAPFKKTMRSLYKDFQSKLRPENRPATDQHLCTVGGQVRLY
jgi:hypothetical protein